MNHRVYSAKTPWERLAAVAISTIYRIQQRFKDRPDYARIPDYADFRADFEKPMRRELIQARIEEARLADWPGQAERLRELFETLASETASSDV